MDYDIEYFETMLRINSSTARLINEIRWEWVKDVHARTILDYGSGVGFFRAFRNNGAQIDTYDIGPYCQTGITRDYYDLVTMWDVIEHLGDMSELDRILAMTDHLAATIPILPHGKVLEKWKHYKPGEHMMVFHEGDLEWWMDGHGFDLVKAGIPECPPREEVVSFLFRRRNGCKVDGRV